MAGRVTGGGYYPHSHPPTRTGAPTLPPSHTHGPPSSHSHPIPSHCPNRTNRLTAHAPGPRSASPVLSPPSHTSHRSHSSPSSSLHSSIAPAPDRLALVLRPVRLPRPRCATCLHSRVGRTIVWSTVGLESAVGSRGRGYIRIQGSRGIHTHPRIERDTYASKDREEPPLNTTTPPCDGDRTEPLAKSSWQPVKHSRIVLVERLVAAPLKDRNRASIVGNSTTNVRHWRALVRYLPSVD
jgi:hypothetical protein